MGSRSHPLAPTAAGAPRRGGDILPAPRSCSESSHHVHLSQRLRAPVPGSLSSFGNWGTLHGSWGVTETWAGQGSEKSCKKASCLTACNPTFPKCVRLYMKGPPLPEQRCTSDNTHAPRATSTHSPRWWLDPNQLFQPEGKSGQAEIDPGNQGGPSSPPGTLPAWY